MVDIYVMSGNESGEYSMSSGLFKGFLMKPFGPNDITLILENCPDGSRVMVVDDVEIVRKNIGNFISCMGYDPILCSSGEEAIREYREDIPLVFTDFDMPGMNGLELARILKKGPENRFKSLS